MQRHHELHVSPPKSQNGKPLGNFDVSQNRKLRALAAIAWDNRTGSARLEWPEQAAARKIDASNPANAVTGRREIFAAGAVN